VAPATNTFMGASFPIHLRADTSGDKIALLPVTHPVSPLDAPTRPEGRDHGPLQVRHTDRLGQLK
jgi:hypothetical protein